MHIQLLSYTHNFLRLRTKQNYTLCIMFLILLNQFERFLFETELKFCSKLTSFCSQTWLLLLVCLGKCFPFEIPKDCCSIQLYINYSNCIEQQSFGISKGKHFPRQTRRSSHVWLRKLVSLEQNFSSVSKRTFQIENYTLHVMLTT